MKRIINIICSLLLVAGTMAAQEKERTIEEEVRIMDLGAENAFTITMEEMDPILVAEVWRSYVRANFKSGTRLLRNDNEFISENAKVRLVTGFPVHLIAQITELGPRVDFSIWIDLQGAYLSSDAHPEQAEEVIFILRDFAVQVERIKIEERLKEEERILAKMERQLYRLERAKQRYDHEVGTAEERRVIKMKSNIDENTSEQEVTAKEIAAQQKIVAEIRRQLMTVN